MINYDALQVIISVITIASVVTILSTKLKALKSSSAYKARHSPTLIFSLILAALTFGIAAFLAMSKQIENKSIIERKKDLMSRNIIERSEAIETRIMEISKQNDSLIHLVIQLQNELLIINRQGEDKSYENLNNDN